MGAIKFYVGVTDNNWFSYLKNIQPDEVNFWQPSGTRRFRVLKPYELFLFKLHSPLNYITGGGFFVSHSILPVSLAWDAFNTKNGLPDFPSFLDTILDYKKSNREVDPDPKIGCIVLTQPFFFEEKDWLPIPKDWKLNIVQGKSYTTDTFIGKKLYQDVFDRLNKYIHQTICDGINEEISSARYGLEQIIQPRLGQGAFRVLVTEKYNHKCAITGERTLPVLEAAHIKPYSQNGPHSIQNGLLLRKDLHTLFDRGYLTVTDKLHVEVSKRIKEDYGNGREYYALHGKKLSVIPGHLQDKPSEKYLRWHNDNVFLAR